MQVQAKFQCQTVLSGVGVETPSLTAVNGANGSENAQWAKYTPSGSIVMQINNEAAQGFFQPGKSYLVTFTEAPEA